MKKVWIYQRKHIKGWWIGWYESGIRKAKALPTKELAEHYRHIKYTQLNSDVFTGAVSADWNQMVSEYRESKKVQEVTEGTLYEIALSLRNFQRLCGKSTSKQITQFVIDKFILLRGNEVKRATLNKDIRNLKAFISWCREQRYVNGLIKLKELKEAERPVKSLNDTQVRKLQAASEQYSQMRMRILIALGTGLRRGDIDSLKITDIDFERNYISTTSQKTKKCMDSRPIPVEVMNELSKYVDNIKNGQEALFDISFNHRQWRKICQKAALINLKFHDLRRTFCSALAQRGVSSAVPQRLLELSSAELTNRIYTNVDPVLRKSIEQLPVDKWLHR